MQITRIHALKTGPFHEHSSQLYAIATGVPHWAKANQGLLKMYDVSCDMHPLPVVSSHFGGTATGRGAGKARRCATSSLERSPGMDTRAAIYLRGCAARDRSRHGGCPAPCPRTLGAKCRPFDGASGRSCGGPEHSSLGRWNAIPDCPSGFRGYSSFSARYCSSRGAERHVGASAAQSSSSAAAAGTINQSKSKVSWLAPLSGEVWITAVNAFDEMCTSTGP